MKAIPTVLALAGLLSVPAAAGAQSLTLRGGTEPHVCADLDVRFDQEPALIAEQELRLPGSGQITLTAPSRGGIRVRGSERTDVLVRVCKAVPASRGPAAADQISAASSNGRVTVSGPAHDGWVAYMLVEAPRGTAFDLEAQNGPLSVHDFEGRVRARSVNGPITLSRVSGDITARAQNGPIQFDGQAGKVDLDVQNGPIQVRLAGTEWTEGNLTARTQNGPVQLSLPDGYRSGVLVSSSGRSPWSCDERACDDGRRTWTDSGRQIEFGTGPSIVRVSTVNGPVQVKTAAGSR